TSTPVPSHTESTLYAIIQQIENDRLSVPSVFIIDPSIVLRLINTYPASTGRNFEEVLRTLDSLQLTDRHSVATPVNWKHGDDVIIVPSLKDPEVLKAKFPKGWTEQKPYLRVTPQPDL